jgi:hypothetical protein
MPKWLDNLIFWRTEAKAARAENSPRVWTFVNAYGPQQATADIPQTFHEACAFLREHVGCSFVRADHDNAIIFFDGRKLGGQ